ncbi:response regulator [Paenibacillus albicereus]|uniref:Response regulator n=1 Tax=Paenibacillus albicereus TaxID=2726185 RepID=A0A6H2GSL6_9BACL|nr:response regulator [Paenibacillus albicereus]QJC50400.1 response regulator [Paenibacillus albicereus]
MIRVLIVDDDKLARKGLISILPWSSQGMTVVGEAANGAKALEFMERQEVDLLFVDLSMPVLSGLELLRIVQRRFPSVRSVVLSFHEEFENVQAAYRMGVLDYLSKVRLESEDDEQILRRIRERLASEPPRSAGEAAANSAAGSEAGPADMAERPAGAGSASGPATAPADSSPVAALQAARPGGAPRPAEEDWAAIEAEWRSMHWLYSEARFQRLCKRTAEAGASVPRLAGLLQRIAAPLETIHAPDFGRLAEAGDIAAALQWMRDCRSRIYAHVAAASDCATTMESMLKAVLFIRERSSEALHAEAAAEHVHMSRSYFCQCFKKWTGMTFHEYVRQERISAAERLLCETNRSIGWIAHSVGYSDAKYFSQLFHEQTSLLPSEFRAQFQKGEE